jgi:hypothetical protein
MGEVPVKDQPKEEPKKNILTLVIDLDALVQPQNLPPIPENQDIWKDQNSMSKEYQDFMNSLGCLMIYAARAINAGPEIKDNSTKRMITIKTLLDMFFQNLNVTGYMAYGLLTELTHDTYMKISGRQQTIALLKHIQKKGEKVTKEKSKAYVS